MARDACGRSGVIILLLALSLAAQSALAQGTGNVHGLIRNEETKEQLDYANVVLTRVADQAQWGAMSLGGGRFFLNGIPAGRYTLKVLYLGYKPVTQDLEIRSGETLNLTFDLEVTVVKQFDVFTVEGDAVMVEVKETEFSQKIGSEDLTDYAVDTVEDAVARQAGVTQRNGELHVRGGRSGEISFRIDGVAVDDPLGGSALSVGSFSVQNVETVTGGQDPEYGNALSGVVDITTKEGNPDKFEMQARFMTDDFGRQDRTFTNYDRFEFGFGGPALTRKLTYYISGDMRFSDTENYNRANREEHELDLFGTTIAKWRRRQVNDIKGSTKWAYHFDSDRKLTAEYTLGFTRNESYFPNWDVQGYARQLVILPQVTLTGSGDFQYAGRTQIAFYGPWVENIAALSKPAVIVDGEGRRETMPILTIQNINGEEVTVIAQPVFEGFRHNQSTFFTEKAPEDTSLVAFNSADRGPQNQRFSNQAKVVWKHTLTDDTFYTVRLGRVQFSTFNSTGLDRKLPQQFVHGGLDGPGTYGGQVRQYRTSSAYTTDTNHPFFVTEGDWPFYQDRDSKAYTLKTDMQTGRYEGHLAKAGIQLVYNDMQEYSLNNPAREIPNRFTGAIQQGTGRSIFHAFNPEASFYLQDRWEYEGMVISGGFRWDMFSSGSIGEITVDNEDVNRNVEKYKHQFSPRLGFSFPITDRASFHFHYGRFVQFPGREVLFASQEAVGSAGTLGNPNLEAMTTIQYQTGIRQQLGDYLALEFAVYSRDFYNLIGATQVTDNASGQQVNRYINRAFGNARGIELTLNRRMHDRWSFNLAYSYAFADGVASSQEFGSNPDGLQFLPSQELPLDWDQRHTVNMDLRIQEPNAWAASLVFDYGSGYPWTPVYRFERRQDPLLENSARLPADYTVRIQAERHVNVYGQKLILYLQGFNLLNQDQVSSIGAGLPPGSIDANSAYVSYLTETGKYGGAYLQDVDGDNRDDFVPLNDPRVFAEHRLFRVGVSWAF